MSLLHPTSLPIHELSARIATEAAALPFARLAPEEARALGGRLFAAAPLFVEAVARALREQPALFADVPGAAELPGELLGAQSRAAAFRLLAQQLGGLAALAQDSFLREQAWAVEAATRLVHHVEAAAAAPYVRLAPAEERDRHRLRLAALLDALRLRRQRSAPRPAPRGAPQRQPAVSRMGALLRDGLRRVFSTGKAADTGSALASRRGADSGPSCKDACAPRS